MTDQEFRQRVVDILRLLSYFIQTGRGLEAVVAIRELEALHKKDLQSIEEHKHG